MATARAMEDSRSGPGMRVKLVAKDRKEFEVERDVACLSETIKVMLGDDCSPDEAIPLQNIESFVLARVIEFCKYHCGPTSELDRNSWNKEFIVRVDDGVLFNLIRAARYLQIDSLLSLACERIAEYIKECNTPEEIRKRFNIKNDFTPEEEDDVRRQNAWCGGGGALFRGGDRSNEGDERVDHGDGSDGRGGGGEGEGREMTEETRAAMDAARAHPDFDKKVCTHTRVRVHVRDSSIGTRSRSPMSIHVRGNTGTQCATLAFHTMQS